MTGHPDFWSELFNDANIVADDDILQLEEGAHDLVVHAMALHWANDPVGQLIQCRRALKPDGLFLAVLPSGQTLNELRSVLTEAEVSIRGGLSPRVMPMADIRDLGGLLQRAGFALPVADLTPLAVEYDDLLALGRDLRAMGEGNALGGRQRSLTRRDLFALAHQIYAQRFPGDQKALRATFELVTLTGWAPASSQPQPLRPGSAQARLADALKTDETRLPD
ncbi:methyltransferase domain-containing protein [Aliishimia ponticola]|uniref:methyltransferase domain-containing protein n=1 Tax=Aliishimia ponticola TaxID=2499833 RepID=UPI00319E6D39